MSTALSFAGKQMIIYFGIPAFITGVVGGFLSTVVFLSLRTFRQSSCAFYLTIMSILNVCSLFLGIFLRISTALSEIDPTETSLFYCKFRIYAAQVCVGSSLTCLCLAMIDQYFATCSRPRWQQFCNIKLARRVVIMSIILWMLHGIPYLVFYDHVLSSTTNKITCINTNYIYEQYRVYFIIPGLLGYLPIVIAAFFGLMAYHNVKQIAYRTVPLVRRELDKQLTIMVLIQVVVSVFTLLPYTTVNAVATNTNLTSDPVIQEKLQFAVTVTLIIFFLTFASPFYIYICASERFRRQLIHVLSTIVANRCERPRIDINQVVPDT